MVDELVVLAGNTDAALQPLGLPAAAAGGCLLWAAFNLRAARMGQRIVEELGTTPTGLQAIFPEGWDVMEVAAMSLGFGDVQTALDLCSHATFLASGGTPSANGSYKDLGYWTPARAGLLSPKTRQWLLELMADPENDVLAACRHALTHRTVRRLVSIQFGGESVRSLAEITLLPTKARPAVSLGSIGDLIPRLVAFGEHQFRRCCQALIADYGP